MSIDPLSAVYGALWSVVESHPSADRLVKLGNRVRYDQNKRDPMKEAVASADVPELQLLPNGGTVKLMRTSATTELTKNYQWVLATGDMRVAEYLNPIEWMLIEAMCDAQRLLATLRFAGQETSFVKRFDVTNLTEGFSDAARNRGIQGWSSVLGLEVEMHFKTSAVLAWKD